MVADSKQDISQVIALMRQGLIGGMDTIPDVVEFLRNLGLTEGRTEATDMAKKLSDVDHGCSEVTFWL